MATILPYNPWCVYKGDFIYKMGTQAECLHWMALGLNGLTTAQAYARGYRIIRYKPQTRKAA